MITLLISHTLLKIFYFNDLRSRTLTFEKTFYICFNGMPLEMMKNDFYFMLKALLVFKIFKFLSSLFWSCIVKVNFKIYDATD